MATESKQADGRKGAPGGRFGKGGGRGGRFGRGGRGTRGTRGRKGKPRQNAVAANDVTAEPSGLKANAPEFKPRVATPSNERNNNEKAQYKDNNQKQAANSNKSDGKQGSGG